MNVYNKLHFNRNLVSISCLNDDGLIVQFNSLILIRSLYSIICFGDLMNSLYYLSPLSYDANNFEIEDDEHRHFTKKRKI